MLSRQSQLRKALSHAAAAADRNSTIFDVRNWTGIVFEVHVHGTAAGATCDYEVYESNAEDMSGETLVTDLELTIGDTVDDQVLQLDYFQPQKSFVRLKCNKDGTNNVTDSAVARLYGPRVVRPTAITGELQSVAVTAGLGS